MLAHLLVFSDLRVFIPTSYQPLGCIQRVLWVGDGLSLGWKANKHLIILAERDDGWRRSNSLRILNDTWLLQLRDTAGKR